MHNAGKFGESLTEAFLRIVACRMHLRHVQDPLVCTTTASGQRRIGYWVCTANVDGASHLVRSSGMHPCQLVAAIEELSRRVALARKPRAS